MAPVDLPSLSLSAASSSSSSSLSCAWQPVLSDSLRTRQSVPAGTLDACPSSDRSAFCSPPHPLPKMGQR